MHEGKARIMSTPTQILLLCPHGHYIDSINRKDWAGSRAEANWQNRIAKCNGTIKRRQVTKNADGNY